MNRCRTMFLLLVLFSTIELGLVACASEPATTTVQSLPGSGAVSTSARPVATTTTAPGAVTPTTAAGVPSTVTSVEPSADIVKYVADFNAWLQALYQVMGELSILGTVEDVTRMTAEDLAEAETTVATAHELSRQLRAIETPAAVATLHEKVVAGFDARVVILDKVMQGMRDKDQGAVDAAIAEGQTETAFTSAMDEWASLLGGITPGS